LQTVVVLRANLAAGVNVDKECNLKYSDLTVFNTYARQIAKGINEFERVCQACDRLTIVHEETPEYLKLNFACGCSICGRRSGGLAIIVNCEDELRICGICLEKAIYDKLGG
jgi:hypothetical protein